MYSDKLAKRKTWILWVLLLALLLGGFLLVFSGRDRAIRLKSAGFFWVQIRPMVNTVPVCCLGAFTPARALSSSPVLIPFSMHTARRVSLRVSSCSPGEQLTVVHRRSAQSRSTPR